MHSISWHDDNRIRARRNACAPVTGGHAAGA